MVQIQINKVRDLVKDNLLEGALGVLLSLAPDTILADNVILLFRQFSFVFEERLKGLINYEQHMLETNKIVNSILMLLRHIEKKQLEKPRTQR